MPRFAVRGETTSKCPNRRILFAPCNPLNARAPDLVRYDPAKYANLISSDFHTIISSSHFPLLFPLLFRETLNPWGPAQTSSSPDSTSDLRPQAATPPATPSRAEQTMTCLHGDRPICLGRWSRRRNLASGLRGSRSGRGR